MQISLYFREKRRLRHTNLLKANIPFAESVGFNTPSKASEKLRCIWNQFTLAFRHGPSERFKRFANPKPMEPAVN
jgi:hypothetical protein